MAYGKQLLLDLYGCDATTFNRKSVEEWLEQLCKLLNMIRADIHFWDYEGVPEDEIPYDQPHLVGTSAVQFITTSAIVVHTINLLEECYIDIFSCKGFDEHDAGQFTRDWFKAKKISSQVIYRGMCSKYRAEGIPEAGDCMDCFYHGKCTGPEILRLPCFNHRKESIDERSDDNTDGHRV